jgi:hypothetical protein
VRRYSVADEDRLLFHFMGRGDATQVTTASYTGELYVNFARRFGLAGLSDSRVPAGYGAGWSEPLHEWREMHASLRNLESRLRAGTADADPRDIELEHQTSYHASRVFAPYLRLQPTIDSSGRRVVQREPIALAGILWAQMLRRYTGDLDWRICRGCGEAIPIGTDRSIGKRQDAQFCDASCRTRYTNRWRSEALHLKRQGHKVVDIAREVNIEPRRVREWLATAKRQSARPRRRSTREE